MSEFVQGYWRLAEWGMTIQQCLAFIEQHIELGVTTVDHADIYGRYQSERLFGEALALSPSLRQQLQIVTKCGIKLTCDSRCHTINHYDSSALHIVLSVDTSLTQMGIDEIDLLLIHRPDLLMNADEVADAFAQLHQQGKVKQFGVSNFSPSQMQLLQSRLSVPLVTNQLEINPLNLKVLEDGSLDLLQQLAIRPMAWSCLAGGRVCQPIAEHQGLTTMLMTIATEIGAQTPEQVIYAWIRALPVKPHCILGSGKIARVKQAVTSQTLTLTREQWYRIWTAAKGHGVA
ncbi:aldo/keto reductase [Shewanella sp. NIFS-20-20]|nr:aldo/keto reductase [Shewanella sp. NIFS-20-20]